MSVEERDLRMVMLAFEDVATWCESLADLSDRFIQATRSRQSLTDAELQAARDQIAETRRYIESNRSEVRRIKERTKIS